MSISKPQAKTTSLYTNLCFFMVKWVVLPLFLLILLAFSGVYIFFKSNHQYIVRELEQIVEQNTGLTCRIRGEIAPSLLPLQISVTDIELVAYSVDLAAPPDLILKIQHVGIIPDISDYLFSKSFALRKISINQPVGIINQGLLQKTTAPENSSDESAQQPAHVAQQLVNSAQPQGNETARVHAEAAPVTNTRSDLLLTLAEYMSVQWAHYLPNTYISNGSLVVVDSRQLPILSVQAIELRLQPLQEYPKATLSALLHIPQENVLAQLEMNTQLDPLNALSGSLQGNFSISPYKSPPLHASFSLPFVWENIDSPIQLPAIRVTAENDHLEANLTLQLSPFLLSGPVRIDNLSLPRWFFFARNLPPALQDSLHAISGTGDLSADKSQVFIHNLQAKAKDLPVSGFIGTKSFVEPKVEADLALDFGDIDQLLPVLATSKRNLTEPDEPNFPHPPLAPYPTRPPMPGEKITELIDVSYDINIHAQDGIVHDIATGPFSIRIHPGSGLITRIGFQAQQIAKGSLNGYIDIDRPFVTMHFDVKNADLSLLPENEGSSVTVAGRMTGIFGIGIDVQNGDWSDDWDFTASTNTKNFTLSSDNDAWSIMSKDISTTHKGIIHAVRKDGITLKGLWNTNATGLASSWNPGGKETLSVSLDGTVAWPIPGKQATSQPQDGIDQVFGTFTSSGTITARLGDLLTPFSGTTTGYIDWNLASNWVEFKETLFKGHKSSINGTVRIDYDNDVVVDAKNEFSVNLRKLLTDWDLLPGDGFIIPELVTGSSTLRVDGPTLTLNPLRMAVNKAPLQITATNTTDKQAWKNISAVSLSATTAPPSKGSSRLTNVPTRALPRNLGAQSNASATRSSVNAQDLIFPELNTETKASTDSAQTNPLRAKSALTRGTPSFWNISVAGDFLDIDALMVQRNPKDEHLVSSNAPFNLDALEYFNVDARVNVETIMLQKLVFKKNTLGLRMLEKNYGLLWDASNFYKGTSRIFSYGTLTMPSQISVKDSGMHLRNFRLEQALHALLDTTIYEGNATALFDTHGAIRSNADMPGGLAGTFSFAITDGAYPAFIGSKTAGLQNTFSSATATGTISKGILQSEDFKLKGIMVDITGNGWVDLYRKLFEARAVVTLAKIPSIPVTISGPFHNLTVSVTGKNTITKTTNTLTSAVGSIFQTIIELPQNTYSTISDLVSPDSDKLENGKNGRTKTPDATPPKQPRPVQKNPKSTLGPRRVPKP